MDVLFVPMLGMLVDVMFDISNLLLGFMVCGIVVN